MTKGRIALLAALAAVIVVGLPAAYFVGTVKDDRSVVPEWLAGGVPRKPVPEVLKPDMRPIIAQAEMKRIHEEGFLFVIDGRHVSAKEAALLPESEWATRVHVFRPAARGLTSVSAIKVGDRTFVDAGIFAEFMEQVANQMRRAIVVGVPNVDAGTVKCEPKVYDENLGIQCSHSN